MDAPDVAKLLDFTDSRVLVTGSGQGIGLAVVNEIVSQYSGKLSLSSSALSGASVQVVIPIE